MGALANPKRRKVPARIFVSGGWVVGTFHVPPEMSFLKFLNTVDGFFRLTDVMLPQQRTEVPFLALQRSAVVLVVAGADERLKPTEEGSEGEPRRVSCLFEGGLLMGALTLPQGVRVSDRLMEFKGFFVMNECTLGLDAKGPSVEAASVVMVNAPRIIGVSEMR